MKNIFNKFYRTCRCFLDSFYQSLIKKTKQMYDIKTTQKGNIDDQQNNPSGNRIFMFFSTKYIVMIMVITIIANIFKSPSQVLREF